MSFTCQGFARQFFSPLIVAVGGLGWFVVGLGHIYGHSDDGGW